MRHFIIFDMDGVVINSESAIRLACTKMFEHRNLAVSPNDFIPFTGMGDNQLIKGVAEKYGIVFTPEMKYEAYTIYDKIADESVVVFDGIKEMIKKLSSYGYKLALASASDRFKVNINLRCMGLSEYAFNTIVTGDDVTKHKPDPEVFLVASEKLGGTPEEIIVVEDAVAGCRAAKAAGMACIGVTSTFDGSTLKEAGADYIVEKTTDILPLLIKKTII